MASGSGAYLEDVDGHRYLDLVLSWGPLILGHAAPNVVYAIIETARRGTTFGAPCELELDLAERVIATFPAMEMVRFVSSGTEATMSALRLARAATGRDGHREIRRLLSRARRFAAGGGRLRRRHPRSPGFARRHRGDGGRHARISHTTIWRHWSACSANGETPSRRSSSSRWPATWESSRRCRASWMDSRALTARHGAILIFDEVMTGWRVHPGGAQSLFGIEPDLTCIGKVVGGGLPAAAYGGRAALMQQVAPAGPVYQAGTLSGNPLAMAAGIATLDALEVAGTWQLAARWAERATAELARLAAAAEVPLLIHRVGTMFTPFFTESSVTDFTTAREADREAYRVFFHAMLADGVYLAPSAFEAAFTSVVHDDVALARWTSACESSLLRVREVRNRR